MGKNVIEKIYILNLPRIHLGPGGPSMFGIWIGEWIPQWDSRIFSVVTSFCAMLFGTSMILTTNMGMKTLTYNSMARFTH